MAIANRIDLDRAAAGLTDCLRRRLPDAGDATVGDVGVSQSSGMSNETVFFSAVLAGERRRFVARVAPVDGGLYPAYDLEREHRVMTALATQTGLPVPRPWFVECDRTVLGAPFLLMPFVEGHALADDPPFTVAGWMFEQTPQTRARVNDEALRRLAEIHAVDWQALGLERLAPDHGTPLAARLARDERWYAWAADGTPSPTVDAAFAWLREHQPADPGPAVLNWGDARLSNMIFGDGGEVRAILDWEAATVGPPAGDLAWWLFATRHHTEGIGAPLPEGFPEPAALVARYEELSGNRVEHLGYYEVLCGLEAALIMLRVGAQMIAAGLVPPGTPIGYVNPAAVLLADLVGAPRPAGEALSFIGNRG